MCLCVGVRFTLILASLYLSRARIRHVHYQYPIEVWTLSKIHSEITLNLTHNKLSCIVDETTVAPSYIELLLCFAPFVSFKACGKMWGSRSVIMDVTGSIEIIKLSQKPITLLHNDNTIINATRWLQLSGIDSNTPAREIVHVPAEPTFLCSRSNDWNEKPAVIQFKFRDVFMRKSDQYRWSRNLIYHVLLLSFLSSSWAMPYIVACIVGTFSFLHGLKKIMLLFALCGMILCLTPLMLTNKHRVLAKHYIDYFFTRGQLEETKVLLRHRKPLFQALYFSSALLCVGCVCSYIIFHYVGVPREFRNFLLKVTIGAAVAWLTFFVCRSFERFFVEWIWVAVVVGLAKTMEDHVNPLSRDKMLIALLLVSFTITHLIKRLSTVFKMPQFSLKLLK